MIPGTDERRLRSRTSAHAIFNISGQCWHCSVFEKYQNMYIYIYTVYTSLTQSFAFSWLLPLLTIIQSRRSEVIIFHTNPYGRPKNESPDHECHDWTLETVASSTTGEHPEAKRFAGIFHRTLHWTTLI